MKNYYWLTLASIIYFIFAATTSSDAASGDSYSISLSYNNPSFGGSITTNFFQANLFISKDDRILYTESTEHHGGVLRSGVQKCFKATENKPNKFGMRDLVGVFKYQAIQTNQCVTVTTSSSGFNFVASGTTRTQAFPVDPGRPSLVMPFNVSFDAQTTGVDNNASCTIVNVNWIDRGANIIPGSTSCLFQKDYNRFK